MTRIGDYIREHGGSGLPLLERIEKEHHERQDIQPCVGPEAGRYLSLMIRSLYAKRVLELGTCLGYASIWMGEALKTTGGTLTSVELNKSLFDEAVKNIREAGLNEQVRLIHGDAREVIRDIEGPFDLILQDADKSLYPELLEDCIRLTRPGGLIVADDALFKPMGIPAKFSDPVHRYVTLAFDDPRLYSVLLPLGDGLLVSTKL